MSSEPLQPPTPGSPPPRYDFLKVVGEGSMGQIHLVAERSLQRRVALKTLHQKVMQDRTALGRFLNEVQITAQLDHPNVVPVYNLEQMDGSLAYTMKMVEGQTLKQVLQTAREQWENQGYVDENHGLDNLLEYFLKVCEAMHYAHSKGVIHRDLKPASLMIGPYGEVYVMDWGIARLMGGGHEQGGGLQMNSQIAQHDLELTQAGQILGTPRYMSPEQIRGKNNELDARSDLFALGAILFELVTLKPAFTGKTAPELLEQILTGQHQEISPLFPRQPLPRDLQAVIGKALQVKREDRYHDLQALIDDIHRYQRGEAVLAAPDSLPQALLRRFRHQRRKVLSLALIFVMLSSLITLGILARQQWDLLQARRQEQAIGRLLASVTSRGRTMDRQFLTVESWLLELAAVTVARLEHPPRQPEPLYVSQEFNPPDLADIPRYGTATSLDWPIVVPGHNAQPAVYRPLAESLASLRQTYRQMLLRSGGHDTLKDPEQARHYLGNSPLPLAWTNTILADANIAFWYPGKDIPAATARNYSPTERPFYLLAAHKQGVHWGKSYIDMTANARLIPVATALYGENNRFWGTINFDLQPEQMVSTYLHLDSEAAVRSVALVNPEGELMLSAKRQGERFVSQPTREGALLEDLGVRAAIAAQSSGYQIYQNTLWLYYYLPSIDWAYVVEADLPSVLAASRD
ncbi:MAG: protein kinase [Candidatus Sericytochromatia bacterium]|nr:protein kinase [Candidatus Sericytochromatia bacterium]